MRKKKGAGEVEMLGALAAGAALGGLIVFVLLSYFWEWGIVKDAKWWELMTAFGTVGAVIVALFFGMKSELDKAFTKHYRSKFIKNKMNNRLSAYLMSLDYVLRATHESNVDRLAMIRLTRLWWIEDISDTDVIELSAFYKDAHNLIQARERVVFLLKIARVPRKFVTKDSRHYKKIFLSLKESGTVNNLQDIAATIREIVSETSG